MTLRRAAAHLSGHSWARCVVALALTCSAAVGQAAGGRLDLVASPVFTNGEAYQGVMIYVDNTGADAKGTVTLDGPGGQTVYPIELPRGAKKSFIGYPLAGEFQRFNPVSCTLDTNRGSVTVDVRQMGYGESIQQTLEISDEPGGLQFLDPGATAAPQQRDQKAAVYVVPEEAPGRLQSYRSLGAVVLGPGSERIDAATVRALKQYVIAGGRLVFIGGAGAPTFRDPRWLDFAPLIGPHSETRTVSLKSGSTFSQALDCQVGTPAPGSVTVAGNIIRRQIGFGVVIAIPFDPLHGPMKSWDGRTRLITNLLSLRTGSAAAWPQNGNQGYQVYGSGAAPSVVRVTPSYPGSTPDPFNFRPPPPMSILVIILAYLVLVAPINFLVLRKLRRSEWAWYTTPLISFVFAGALLRLAAGLYAGKMMTSSRGTLVLAEGSTSAGTFRGVTQLFFPVGGSYDLHMSDIDSIASTSDSFSFRRGVGGDEPLTAIDSGQLLVPALVVRNLQFKELEYQQTVNTSGWVTFTVLPHGRSYEVTIANNSPFALDHGTLYVEGGFRSLDSLASGSRKTVTVAAMPSASGSSGGLDDYSLFAHRPILSATLTGFRPGPQVGEEVHLDPNAAKYDPSTSQPGVDVADGVQNGTTLIAVGSFATGGVQ